MKRHAHALSLPTTLVFTLALFLFGNLACQRPSASLGPVDATDVFDTSDSSHDSDDGSDPDGGSDADVPPIDAGPSNACLPAGEGPEFQISARADLRWKRVHALKTDLLTAMEVTEDEACQELGLALPGICFDIVHLVPLGGNDPIGAAMYRPMASPSLTTVLSIDRVTTAVCGKRVDEDSMAQAAGELANVFNHMDLSAEAIEINTPGLQEQIHALYRRFLTRSATDAEVQIVLQLATPLNDMPTSAREFAKAACFTIATTTEFVFH